MQEVNEKIISKILSRIYRDTMVTQSKDYFITHTYKAAQFESMIDPKSFHSIIGFLPNTKYRGRSFIMSVVFNKKDHTYKVVVHNPSVKY